MNFERIGRRSPEVARLRELLRSQSARRANGSIVLEGKTLLTDVARRGVLPKQVYLASDAQRAFAADLEFYVDAGVPVALLGDGAVERIATTRTPQPLLGEVDSPFWYEEIPEFGSGLLIALDGVADPGNLGTIIRVAEATGAAGVLQIGGCDIGNPKAVRASAGACFGVPVVQVPEVEREMLSIGGRRIFAATSDAELLIHQVEWSQPTTVVLGSESHGISAAVNALVDDFVSIPMDGKV